MRTRTPEHLNSATQHPENAEKMSATTIKAMKNLEKYAYPKGAILSCACKCGYESEKTAEEMKQYLHKWPRMHGYPANVRPK